MPPFLKASANTCGSVTNCFTIFRCNLDLINQLFTNVSKLLFCLQISQSRQKFSNLNHNISDVHNLYNVLNIIKFFYVQQLRVHSSQCMEKI